MGFRPNCFTCIAHLYLYYTLLVLHTYTSYIRHWCIFFHWEIQYNIPVFLIWYQSHCSDLFLAVLSLLVWLLFFNIASAITTTAVAFCRWTSDVIQPSSLGSGPATTVVKEFHTAQTIATRITATNIAPITVLKLPQRSSCADLQNRESLNAVGDHTRPHAPFKVSVRLITRSTRRHAPPGSATHLHTSPRASTRLHVLVFPADVSPRWRHLPRHLPTSSATSSSDVICHIICWRHRWVWPLTLTEGWLFARVDFLQSRWSLPNFSRRFHFCSLFLHFLLVNEE